MPSEPAANTTADPTNDGSLGVHIHDPFPGTDLPRVTQEEEPEPRILNKLVHQVSRVAYDSSDDELFDKITSHEWKSGDLMF